MSTKMRLATVWLDGCSGCHMSFLDMDEDLITILKETDLVYSPLVDFKEFPTDVDITLVEGAVSTSADLEKIQIIRERTKILVSLGDCAITGNVPSLRNPFTVKEVLELAYLENITLEPKIPARVVPKLLSEVKPVHQVVKLEFFLQGCPPSSKNIFQSLLDLIHNNVPSTQENAHFG